MAHKRLNLFFVICFLLTSLLAHGSLAFYQHRADKDEMSVAATQSDENSSRHNTSPSSSAPRSEHCIVHCHIAIGVAPSPLLLNPPQGFEQRVKPATAIFSSRSQDPDLRPPIV